MRATTSQIVQLARICRPAPSSLSRTLTTRLALLGYGSVSVIAHDLLYVRGAVSNDDVSHIVNVLIDEPLGDAVEFSLDTALSGEQRGPNVGSDTVHVEVVRRVGVTDRVAEQITRSAAQLGYHVEAVTGMYYELQGCASLDADRMNRLVNAVLCNAVIETWAYGRVVPMFASDVATDGDRGQAALVESMRVDVVKLCGTTPEERLVINSERALALDVEEMNVVAQWYESIGRDPTDAELETIAQTWSDHCSHKTFRARIVAHTADETQQIEVEPLLSQLRRCTDDIGAPFVVSAFDGNAGIVRFSDGVALAIKAETHNHPSAIEPFGGANTGVGGVIRDVLAAPARPVALTDILCFGPRDLDHRDLPEGVLHPAIIEQGVVDGVADYGNKIGVPTVSGAVLYDPGYVANPLVFCGCIGEVLEGADALIGPQVGDHILVVGGATGRDGIRGATFSSMTMDATTGEVAGASVQIGDPITERLVTDLLIEILDRPDPLCHALTDCGAGGLSSAVGEMGEQLGVDVDLAHVDRKYRGLLPWEVWLSEAQERMVLAVAPHHVDEIISRAQHIGIIANDIGVFTGSGQLVVRHGDVNVVNLPMEFLHDGRPRRNMTATLPDPRRVHTLLPEVDVHSVLLQLLAHPTIASKEAIIRRYDHEILGSTLVRPMSGPEQVGPSDGVVIARPHMSTGFAVGLGVNPQYGIYDPERMAHAVVDEAIRNVVVAGADPSQVALLDNFSWGDPRRASTLGDLVATVAGCCDAARMYKAPFVSGKDSLNNEYTDTDGQRHSIPPTLVITAMAFVPDAGVVRSTAIKSIGNQLWLLGNTRDELRGSHLHLVLGGDFGGEVPAPDKSAPERYSQLHQIMRSGLIESAHDCSEGGIAVALAEMVIASGRGVEVELTGVNEVVQLFAESNGRIIVEVPPHNAQVLQDTFGDSATRLGVVCSHDQLSITTSSRVYSWEHSQLRDAWTSPHSDTQSLVAVRSGQEQ
jgi:phosphoribosylformylglycinamidine synthase subunit PurSL